MKIRTLVLLSLLFFYAGAQTPETVLSAGAGVVVSQGQYYVDHSCSFSFDKISDTTSRKILLSGQLENVAVQDDIDCYWIKFVLANKDNNNNEWLVDFGSWTHVQAYYGDDVRGYRQKTAGVVLPYSQRDYAIGGRSLVMLDIPKGSELTMYVQLKTGIDYMERPVNLSCSVYSKSAVIDTENIKQNALYFFTGLYIVMFLYNLFVYFTIREKSYLYYLFIIFFALGACWQNTGYSIVFLKDISSFPAQKTNADVVVSSIFGIVLILFTRISLNAQQSSPRINKIFSGIIVALVLVVIPVFWGNSLLATNLSSLLGLITTALIIVTSVRAYRQKYPSSGLFLLANGIFMISIFVYLLLLMIGVGNTVLVGFLLPLGSALQIIFYSMALGNSINVLKRQNAESQGKIIEQLRLYSELQDKINKELEQKVEERTRELKESQQQMLQQEKLASLGEVTAGVAHEIQNPLNFIMNFSELNDELIEEMDTEVSDGNLDAARQLSGEIKENMEKILVHGKRVDSIVKGMLQLTRTDPGQKEMTDVNAMCEEFIGLSFHGLRAKDKSFNASMEKHFDSAAGNVSVNKQDVGRVLLNLFTNAFYAVNEKQQDHREGYTPLVTVTTKRNTDSLEIVIRDNGNGIPQKVRDKIFQPFFTTKPTGNGTGLGLSISYEIIKEHGGSIKFNTEEGSFAEFIITLPV
ncbi:MAG TPA: 7TM diverse intracellular signaling domain-containing protein [Panacibacter sp.]|nr:7TM diverse intracellular signaling domain-containing protein [Panacibacter sp.]HNP45396.1 7TM diverse intracellular signaling domain-containing protein [Panacibacter sp.]